MRVCDFCDARETAIRVQKVALSLCNADEKTDVDCWAFDICDGCLANLRNRLIALATPVKLLGQWDAAKKWKEESRVQ